MKNHFLRLVCLYLSAYTFVSAQLSLGGGLPFRVIVQDDLIIVGENHLSKHLTLETPKGIRTFSLPIKNHLQGSSMADFSYFRGRMTSFVLDDPGGERDRGTLYVSWDGRAWTPLARWVDPSDRSKGQRCFIHKAIQLEDDRFLLFGLFQPDETRPPTPVALAAIDDAKRLSIRTYLESNFGFKENLYIKQANKYKRNKKYFSIVLPLTQGEWILETQDHVVFAGLHDGIFLVFDRRGNFKGKYALFEECSEASADTSNHFSVFLSVAPMRDGRILIASPTHEAIQKASRDFPYRFHVSTFWSKENQKNMADAVRAYPDLQWWIFDPARGTFRPQTPPEGVPRRFANLTEMAGFAFRPRLDGSLEITGFQGRQP